jgi:hypothetical protein
MRRTSASTWPPQRLFSRPDSSARNRRQSLSSALSCLIMALRAVSLVASGLLSAPRRSTTCAAI